MPQASAYLPNENDSTSNDIEQPDDSKPETWPLLLPSALPEDDQSPCYKGVVETERVLRLAQLQDSLVDLKCFRRALRNLRLYFKTNLTGEGQKTQTKSRTVETGVNGRIKRSVWRYRTAYRAHLELDPTGDWMNEFRELRDEDNRGPLKDGEEVGTGDGRYAPSWIWTSGVTLSGEGTAAEQQEVNETARHEWMTCRARADRWAEEVELLQEEMRRVLVYLEWKSTTWLQKVGIRAGSCTPDIQCGIDAYARRQAAIHRDIAISFASQWVPYLNATGCETPWAADFPWISEALSRDAKLEKWIPTVSADTQHVGSPLVNSAEGPEPVQEPLDADGAQNEGSPHPNTTSNYSGDSDNEGGDSEEYRGYDRPGYNEDYENGDYENEDCDDEGRNEGDRDDEGGNECVETDDEIGFEYDDDYMC